MYDNIVSKGCNIAIKNSHIIDQINSHKVINSIFTSHITLFDNIKQIYFKTRFNFIIKNCDISW